MQFGGVLSQVRLPVVAFARTDSAHILYFLPFCSVSCAHRTWLPCISHHRACSAPICRSCLALAASSQLRSDGDIREILVQCSCVPPNQTCLSRAVSQRRLDSLSSARATHTCNAPTASGKLFKRHGKQKLHACVVPCDRVKFSREGEILHSRESGLARAGNALT